MTLRAGEKVDKVSRGASGMSVESTGKVGVRASEGRGCWGVWDRFYSRVCEEPGIGHEGWGSKLVLMKSWQRLGGWKDVVGRVWE